MTLDELIAENARIAREVAYDSDVKQRDLYQEIARRVTEHTRELVLEELATVKQEEPQGERDA